MMEDVVKTFKEKFDTLTREYEAQSSSLLRDGKFKEERELRVAYEAKVQKLTQDVRRSM